MGKASEGAPARFPGRLAETPGAARPNTPGNASANALRNPSPSVRTASPVRSSMAPFSGDSGKSLKAPTHERTTLGDSGMLWRRKFGNHTSGALASSLAMPSARTSPNAFRNTFSDHPSSQARPGAFARIAPSGVMCGCVSRNSSASLPLSESSRTLASFQMHGDILRYFITFPPVWRPGRPCRPPLNLKCSFNFSAPLPRAMKRRRSGNGAPMMPASPLIGPGKGCRAPGHSLGPVHESAPYPMYGMDNSIYENKWQQKNATWESSHI